jgi:hypothetical protein
MSRIIDLETELLVDQSSISDPYLRLLAVAIGQRLMHGSPWLAINKAVAEACCFPSGSTVPRLRPVRNEVRQFARRRSVRGRHA